MLAHRFFLKSIIVIFPCIFSIQSYASLLYVDEQSVSSLGNAFAGAGAAGDDASIAFYNPAGLTLIEKGQVVGGVTYAATDIVLDVDSATNFDGNVIPQAAGDEIFVVPQTPLPSLHAAVPINEDWVVGLSFTTPYAIINDYSGTSISNETNKIEFITFNTTLNLAYQLTQALSVGAGLNVQYMNSVVDIYLSAGDPQKDLAFAEYRGDDIAVYPNLGLLYQFNEDKTRVGLSYRFPVTQETEGDFQLEYLQGINTGILIPSSTLEVPLPGIASLSFFHLLTPKIELLADATFEEWSRWSHLLIDFQINGTATGAPLNFKDTWRFGLGANYIFNSAFKLRTGIAYDESPVSDEYRNMGTPDSDRFDVAIGLGISPKSWKKTRIDVAYMHTFFADAPIDQSNVFAFLLPNFTPISNGNTLHGEFNNSVDYIGLQIVREM